MKFYLKKKTEKIVKKYYHHDNTVAKHLFCSIKYNNGMDKKFLLKNSFSIANKVP